MDIWESQESTTNDLSCLFTMGVISAACIAPEAKHKPAMVRNMIQQA
jgi:hypothetical protein